MQVILYSLLVLGGLGVIFAAALGVAAKKFDDGVHPDVAAVNDALPGANCGACGFAGCENYAAAIVQEGASISRCPVGGASVMEAIAQILGVATEEREEFVAFVSCQGGHRNAKSRGDYEGPDNCRASTVCGGTKLCEYGCIGLGDCVRSCPYDAIIITDQGIAGVRTDKCRACGVCVAECPKGIISMVPKSRKLELSCSALAYGKQVSDACRVGCIACGICEKACPVDAIVVQGNIPHIDYAKCTTCGLCVKKCPTSALVMDM
ncbi:MAG: RnfABCDGE type electron transport complex subunit B [Christensenellales bacterium]|jgi:electron transport complex protein RnfB